MGEPKPLASLSSTLLARKGQAKPAMRPQGYGSFGNPFNGQDDLGWNDMGHDPRHPVPIHQNVHPEPVHELPQVMLQREELAEELNLVPHDFHAPEMFAPMEEVEPAEAEAIDEPVYAEAAIERAPVVVEPEALAQGGEGAQGQGCLHAAARSRTASEASPGVRDQPRLGTIDRHRSARSLSRGLAGNRRTCPQGPGRGPLKGNGGY
jgi:hypothetical protein